MSRALRIDQAGQIQRITVHVDINHPYVGDLKVTLTPPGRSAIVLHNQAFSTEPDLVRDYTIENTPALAPLVGQSPVGDWTLTISDQSPGDVGALRGWGVAVDMASAAGFEGLTGAAEIGPLAADVTRLLGELARAINRLVPTMTPR